MKLSCCGVVTTGLVVVLLGGSALAASRSLEQARSALGSFELERVLPLLKKALRETRDREELIDIYLLMTDMYFTYDRYPKAVGAFVEVLKRDPAFEPEPGSSPKVMAAYQEAKNKLAPPPPKKKEPPAKKATPAAPEPKPPVARSPERIRTVAPSGPAGGDLESDERSEIAARPPDRPPDYLLKKPEDADSGSAIYKQWWFWTGVGVVVAGAGALTWYLATPKLPPYEYGPVVLSPP